GKDEGPAAGPGPPEAAAQIRDEDADLDREGAGEGLADRDPLAHLGLCQPSPLLDELPLHLAAQGHRAAESERAQPQVVRDELADRHAARNRRAGGGVDGHRFRSPSAAYRPSKSTKPWVRTS